MNAEATAASEAAQSALSEVKSIFGGAVPLIFRVMERRGLLPTHWPLVKGALSEDGSISDEIFASESGELRIPIPELVQFHQKLRGESSGMRPVVIICSWCKDVKGVEGDWLALETVLTSLDRDTVSSHGLCPRCQTTVADM